MSYIQKFKDNPNTQNVHHHFRLVINKKLLLLLFIVLAIPATVILTSREQDTRSKAAGGSRPPIRGYIIEFRDPSLTRERMSAGTAGARSPEDRRVNLEAQHAIAKQNLLSILNKSEYTAVSPSSASEVKILGEYENVLNGIALDITREQADKLKAQSPYVKEIYPNYEVEALLMDSVPLINANKVWNLRDLRGQTITGKNINIGIIDTGVDYRHPALGASAQGQIFNSKVTNGYDLYNEDDDPMDERGHGTHVAAIAAGNGVLKGVAPGARITSYKIFGSPGAASPTGADIINALEAVSATRSDDDPNNDISVVNLSVGINCQGVYDVYCGPDDKVSEAVDSVSAEGVSVVIAAGNGGPNPATIRSPGTARSAITVGSVNKSKGISSFSSRGPISNGSEILVKPDVVAPGEDICSARFSGLTGVGSCVNGDYYSNNGTSMAAPHVAGLVALIKQQDPNLSPLQIKELIKSKAVSLGLDQNTEGSGIIDASKIFDFSEPPVSETPTPEPPASKFFTATAFQDSFVSKEQPGTNYGTNNKLRIDGSPQKISYLKFDLAPVAGKTIKKATLKLKIPKADGSGSSNKFSLRRVNQSAWTENGIKYSNRPSLGSQVTTFTGKGPGNLIQVDVTNAVKPIAGQRVGWAITSSGSNELILNSRNATSGRPQLMVEYQ